MAVEEEWCLDRNSGHRVTGFGGGIRKLPPLSFCLLTSASGSHCLSCEMMQGMEGQGIGEGRRGE